MFSDTAAATETDFLRALFLNKLSNDGVGMRAALGPLTDMTRGDLRQPQSADDAAGFRHEFSGVMIY